MVIGTIPLDLAVDGSDLDIAFHTTDLNAAAVAFRSRWRHHPGFSLRHGQTQGAPSLTVRLSFQGLPVAVLASPLPLHTQHGARHFRIEADLLGLLGPTFHSRVRQLRDGGQETASAFACALSLHGDPHEAILRLLLYSDEAIITRWQGLSSASEAQRSTPPGRRSR